MYQFEVKEMTCGHCERAIRNEIEDLLARRKAMRGSGFAGHGGCRNRA